MYRPYFIYSLVCQVLKSGTDLFIGDWATICIYSSFQLVCSQKSSQFDSIIRLFLLLFIIHCYVYSYVYIIMF